LASIQELLFPTPNLLFCLENKNEKEKEGEKEEKEELE
jgi:hypothetical protein